MNKRVLLAIGIIAAVFTVLLIGSAFGAGVIYFLTQSPEPVFAAQVTEPDPEAGLIVVSVDAGSRAVCPARLRT